MKHISKVKLTGLFLWFGFTSFGGVAALPHIRKALVEEKKYIAAEGFDYGVALAQMLPGATLVQVASYTGYQLQGVWGSFLAALGIFFPAALLMYVFTLLYFHFQSAAIVTPVIEGMNAVIVIIVLDATLKTARSNLGNIRRYFTAFCGFLLYFLQINALVVILVSVITGMLLCNDRSAQPANHQKTPGKYRILLTLYCLLILSVAILWLTDQKTGLLALLMFKTGLLAYGGGYAAIPIYLHDVVTTGHWMSLQQFMTGITLGQITPGPVIVTAVYIGFTLLGTLGSITAFCFILFPDMLLALLILPIFDKLLANKWFFRGMQGVLCAFAGMLLSTAVTMSRQLTCDILTITLLFASIILIIIKRVPPWLVILLAVVAEIIRYLF